MPLAWLDRHLEPVVDRCPVPHAKGTSFLSAVATPDDPVDPLRFRQLDLDPVRHLLLADPERKETIIDEFNATIWMRRTRGRRAAAVRRQGHIARCGLGGVDLHFIQDRRDGGHFEDGHPHVARRHRGKLLDGPQGVDGGSFGQAFGCRVNGRERKDQPRRRPDDADQALPENRMTVGDQVSDSRWHGRTRVTCESEGRRSAATLRPARQGRAGICGTWRTRSSHL